MTWIAGWARRAPLGVLGIAILATIAAMGLAAPLIAPFDPQAISLTQRLLPPLSHAGPGAGAGVHVLGTDSVGRDVLSRIIYGARVSLAVGVAAVALGSVIGTLVGLASGYLGGITDAASSWLIDVQLSFPFLLLAIFLLSTLGRGLLAVVLILALNTWVNYARIVRGQVLSIRTHGYVTAARATGAGPLRLILVHILPNTLASIALVASFSMAQAIMTEAGLSFLGVGIDPGTPSWGVMLNDGRDYLRSAWWIATMPGLAIGITILGISLVGDMLRDVIDPAAAR